MKRFRLIMMLSALTLVAAFGCKKEEMPVADEQEISIQIKGVESGDFTKVSGSAVTTLIESLFPTSEVKFTLSSTTVPDRVYTINLGESKTIPVDTYNVSAYYRPNSVGSTVRNGYIYKNPRFYVETVISVNKGQKNYVVDAIYECWALVIDYTVCSKYQHLGYSYSMEDFNYFHNSGDLGIAFIYGSWTSQAYTIKAFPKDSEGHEAKTYNIVTDRNYSGVFVEYGKWYSFSSSSIDDTSSSLSINYPGWPQGTVSD